MAWWSYTGPALSATLGMAQRFLPAARDGWTPGHVVHLPVEDCDVVGAHACGLDVFPRITEVLTGEAAKWPLPCED